MMEHVIDADMKALGRSINAIKAAWNEKDYPQVVRQCRNLLEHEPENIYGLIYLARSAAAGEEWADVIRSGRALTRRSPRDAFNAARKLNQAGRPLEAAIIYADLDIRGDWFDAKIADLAWKEGLSLLNAGQMAATSKDVQSAKILWMGGMRIAPRSQLLRDRIREFAFDAKQHARRCKLADDEEGYLKAWQEVLWFNPADDQAAIKVARGYERTSVEDAVTAWVRVLRLDPTNETAIERLRKLVGRSDLEEHAIRVLAEAGRDPVTDALLREFAEGRDVKARAALEQMVKDRRREALSHARMIDRAAEPRRYLEAWKAVLILDPGDLRAAGKIISVARAVGDYSELVEGLIAHLRITPGDEELAQRLANAALRAGQEERALEFLARAGMADLATKEVETLHKRVLRSCKSAMRTQDFDHALGCLAALQLVDDQHPEVDALRPILIKRASSSAKEAEKTGNLVSAVPLAAKVLAIAPDQPVALAIVARDLWRHEQFDGLIELCSSRVKPDPEYAAVQKLLDRAAAKMAA